MVTNLTSPLSSSSPDAHTRHHHHHHHHRRQEPRPHGHHHYVNHYGHHRHQHRRIFRATSPAIEGTPAWSFDSPTQTTADQHDMERGVLQVVAVRGFVLDRRSSAGCR